MRERVSTVIPTYNRAGSLATSVGSALAQTHADHEVILVDDGSTDDTQAVARRLFADRVRYLRRANGGVSAARNTGMAAATGDFIALLDSDDAWEPDKLEAQLALLRARPGLGMVITDVARVGADGAVFDVSHRRALFPRDGAILPDVLRRPQMIPSTALIRRAVYEQIGGFDEGLATAEDLDYFMRVALRFEVGLIERPLVRYSVADDDRISARPVTHLDAVRVAERFLAAHADEIAPALRDDALFSVYARNAHDLLWLGCWRDGVALAAKAARRVDGPARALQIAALAPMALRALARRRLR